MKLKLLLLILVWCSGCKKENVLMAPNKADQWMEEVFRQATSLSNSITGTFGYNNIAIGKNAGNNLTNGQHNVILIGENAETTNSFELVIKFKSGKEWRMPLPTNDTVAMWNFINSPQ